MALRLKDLTLVEQVVLALSFILVGLLLIDPFMLERSRALTPEAQKVFKAITDVGRSNWMLIPTGAAIALALVLRQRHVGFRNAAAYGLIASTIGFVFVSVGGAGLIGIEPVVTLVRSAEGTAGMLARVVPATAQHEVRNQHDDRQVDHQGLTDRSHRSP